MTLARSWRHGRIAVLERRTIAPVRDDPVTRGLVQIVTARRSRRSPPPKPGHRFPPSAARSPCLPRQAPRDRRIGRHGVGGRDAHRRAIHARRRRPRRWSVRRSAGCAVMPSSASDRVDCVMNRACGTCGISICFIGGRGGGGVRGSSSGLIGTRSIEGGTNLTMLLTRPWVKSQKPTSCRPMARPTSGARESDECRAKRM